MLQSFGIYFVSRDRFDPFLHAREKINEWRIKVKLPNTELKIQHLLRRKMLELFSGSWYWTSVSVQNGAPRIDESDKFGKLLCNWSMFTEAEIGRFFFRI